MDRAREISVQILETGYAKTTLSPSEIAKLRQAFEAGRELFAMPDEMKLVHMSADMNHGFRPMGVEYSQSKDRPDLNESFSMWYDRSDLIPKAEEIGPLIGAWNVYREFLDSLVQAVAVTLARRFGARKAVDFKSASYLQMNSYSYITEKREFLQDMHEDGHMMTVHYANAPGLEVKTGSGACALDIDRESILFMPGSVLTELTSGTVPPLYHQVRNHRIVGRASLQYFVNPSLHEPVFRWGDPEEAETDLRSGICGNPSAFGLVHVPVL